MKKLLYIFCLGLIFSACEDEFLDHVPDDRLQFSDVFSQRTNVEKYLANVYSEVPSYMDQRYSASNSVPSTGGSDEAEFVWGFHLGNDFNTGAWDPTTGHINSIWSNFYQGIRNASTLIQNIDMCRDCSQEITARYIAEARILRAYYYYLLMRLYGPVILMGEEPVPVDANLEELGLKRNSIDEVTDYIVSELDRGAETLRGVPIKGQNAGRMSRPFAMAIKEKTLLFAASPLFNGNSDYSGVTNGAGEEIFPQTYDAGKWQEAAMAAKDLIDEYVPNTFSLYREYNEDGSYNPYLSTRNVMLEEFNEELIFSRPRGGNSFHYEGMPYHQGWPQEVKGSGGLGPTQEMVDAYFMANGRSIDDPQSGYQEDGFSDFQAPYDFEERRTYNPWTNREPRFYVGVTYNGSLWLDRQFGNIITTTWYGGNSGTEAGQHDHAPTGYIVRKNMPLASWNEGNRSIPIMRLAEIYLDYAEALNEYDPGNPDILTYLNRIRNRAGIPEYGEGALPIPNSKEAMREAIHKERRVELAFESVRYFDARRWKIAEDAFGGPIHMKDINARDEDAFYNTVVMEDRVFQPRHYLWPIPQGEVETNQSLTQNPGW